MKKNIFVMALDDFQLEALRTIHNADQYRFHSLLDFDDVVHVDSFDVDRTLREAEQRLESFDGPVDAIINHWDTPIAPMAAALCERFHLPSAPLRSVLTCGHKYWSRLEQRKSVPECTPRFDKVDPFDERALEKIDLDYPFWLKPVAGFSSQMGFRINRAADFHRAVEIIRPRIRRLGDAVDTLLARVDKPPEMEGVGGAMCIAEQLISGFELAPEGYVHEGKVHVHGMVDLVRGPNRKSFNRCQYPSTVSGRLKQHAIDATERLMTHIDYNNGCFNIEFFWNAKRDKLWLIEVNPRISQSHSHLFEKVDGMSNHEVAVNLGLGRAPHLKRGGGRFRRAAKFWLRKYEDATVARVPSEEEIRRVIRDVPGTEINLNVRVGMRLSELRDQDAYSYELAEIYAGGRNERDMLDNYRRVVEGLNFRFENPAGETPRPRAPRSVGAIVEETGTVPQEIHS